MSNFFLAGIPVSAQAPSSMSEHFDFMWVIVCIALAVITWFAVRTMKQIDKNQANLFDRMHEVEQDLSYLQGEHNTNCAQILPVLQSLAQSMESFAQSVHILVKSK